MTSPGYPGRYGNNLDCRMLVTVPQGHKMRLTVNDLDLADSYDNLLINDGGSRHDGALTQLRQGTKTGTLDKNYVLSVYFQS